MSPANEQQQTWSNYRFCHFLRFRHLPTFVDDDSDGSCSEQSHHPIRPTDRMQRVSKTISLRLIHEFLVNFHSSEFENLAQEIPIDFSLD